MAINPDSPYFAAVDLGSNSFHLLVARVHNERFEIVDREKEMIQLARGINNDGHLSMESQSRALACLARFAERVPLVRRPRIRLREPCGAPGGQLDREHAIAHLTRGRTVVVRADDDRFAGACAR